MVRGTNMVRRGTRVWHREIPPRLFWSSSSSFWYEQKCLPNRTIPYTKVKYTVPFAFYVNLIWCLEEIHGNFPSPLPFGRTTNQKCNLDLEVRYSFLSFGLFSYCVCVGSYLPNWPDQLDPDFTVWSSGTHPPYIFLDSTTCISLFPLNRWHWRWVSLFNTWELYSDRKFP